MSGNLRPVDLTQQSAPFQDRYKILNKLHEQVVKWKKGLPLTKTQELAIKLEARVCKSSTSSQSYRFNMSILLRDLAKYKGNLKEIKIAGKFLIPPNGGVKRNQILIEKKSKAMETLKSILIDQDTLMRNDYIVSSNFQDVASDTEISKYAECVRCNTKFLKDSIKEQTRCIYHPSKKMFNRDTRLYEYPCCGETTGSTSIRRLGCKEHKFHVFKSDKYKDLRLISEFKNTKEIEGVENVLALDCEMGFTSKGYEMIRLTIVDFFSGEPIFDEIVDPFGDIIDLNSEFSGIHEIDMRKAIFFETCMDRVLNKRIINRNSILVGHGLENDLKVMRIIHDKVLDTAILYSNGKYKRSLKDLSFEVLSRKIQGGEHDSSQDAIATMDIIKQKIGIDINKTKWD